MKVIAATDLHEAVRKVLLAAGADGPNAEGVADHLVAANLAGVDTHGVWHLPRYVKAIEDGEILPAAAASIVRESPAGAVVSGNWGFGQVAGRYAIQVAMEKAATHGVAVASMVQAHHTGRLGHYVEMAAAENLISMVWIGGFAAIKPLAVPYGGAQPVLHTNPMAIGFPGGDHPVVIDFATSAASSVKVVLARQRGEQVPPGWLVDKHGQPTTDPNAFFDGGSHVPFGGHKGYALMLAVEILARIVPGADDFADDGCGAPDVRHQGATMFVMKADLFRPFEDYSRDLDALSEKIRSVPPAPGFEKVLIPGDTEAATRASRQREGISIPDETWDAICETAESLGVEL